MPAHAPVKNSAVFLATYSIQVLLLMTDPFLTHLFSEMANAHREGRDTGIGSKKSLSSLERKLVVLDFFFYNTP